MKTHGSFRILNRKVIIFLRDRACETPEEMISSELFYEVVTRFVNDLKCKHSSLLEVFNKQIHEIQKEDIIELGQIFQVLAKMKLETVPKLIEGGERFTANPSQLQNFVESLYNYWREFERFIICDSTGDRLDQRPYRTFNSTIESLTHLVRQTYRDIVENITGQHPSIYRQLSTGARRRRIGGDRSAKRSQVARRGLSETAEHSYDSANITIPTFVAQSSDE